MTQLAPAQQGGEIIERVLIAGDLAKLNPTDRVQYYNAVCHSLGLNPLTQPFAYISLQGKLTLYAKRDCTDQLRKIHAVNITIVSRERLDDVYVVTARATSKDGRVDESIGAVTINGLKGDALANALMKCETKAKRRVTLSIVGLGWLDESELPTISEARPAQVNHDTGEIIDAQPAPQQERPATDKQRGYIDSLVRQLHWNYERLEAFAAERDMNMLTLSVSEAKQLIEELKALADGRPQARNVDQPPRRAAVATQMPRQAEPEMDTQELQF